MPSAPTYAVIGAGPSGLVGARNLDRRGIAWTGFELADDVGGLWDIAPSPRPQHGLRVGAPDLVAPGPSSPSSRCARTSPTTRATAS